MNNRETAKQILDIVGIDNITYATHCATRIRLNIKDPKAIDLSKLDQVEGVIKSQYKTDQLQIIIGAKVGDVFDELQNMLPIRDNLNIEKK